MRSYRLFVAMLLVLFCIGTVHAASMGVAAAPVQDVPVTHCHDMGGGDGHGGKAHPVSDCHCCPACLPGLAAATAPVAPLTASAPALAPQAHYLSHIGMLPLRPPISA